MRGARWLLPWLCAALCRCGGGSHESGGGLVIKQVLKGAEGTVVAVPTEAEPNATPPPVPGMSLGSTLVADTPRALYRRAYDQSRRRADGLTPRERLAAMDEAIDDPAGQEPLSDVQE
jgi:hypothetical protein